MAHRLKYKKTRPKYSRDGAVKAEFNADVLLYKTRFFVYNISETGRKRRTPLLYSGRAEISIDRFDKIFAEGEIKLVGFT